MNGKPIPDDLTKLAMSNDYHELARSTARPTDIPVRKPSRKQYFRVHPDPEWRGAFAIYVDDRPFCGYRCADIDEEDNR